MPDSQPYFSPSPAFDRNTVFNSPSSRWQAGVFEPGGVPPSPQPLPLDWNANFDIEPQNDDEWELMLKESYSHPVATSAGWVF